MCSQPTTSSGNLTSITSVSDSLKSNDEMELKQYLDEMKDLHSVKSNAETPEDKKSTKQEVLETEKLYEKLKPKINFVCKSCGMDEKCHYKGLEAPFVSGGLQFRENCYVLRDPFSSPPHLGKPKAEYFLILGSDCAKCSNQVCKDTACSFFYSVTYCLDCVKGLMATFPKEVQVKAKKQIASIAQS